MSMENTKKIPKLHMRKNKNEAMCGKHRFLIDFIATGMWGKVSCKSCLRIRKIMNGDYRYKKCSCGSRIGSRNTLKMHREKGHFVPKKSYKDPFK